MFQEYEIEIKGVAPVLMHNGQLVDNRNAFVKEMKRYTSRRTKTDEDSETLQHLEWCGGLYFTGNAQIDNGQVTFSNDSKVIMPSDNLWSCIVDGSKALKLGNKFKAALLIDNDGEFIHDGSKDLNALASDLNYHSRKRAGIRGSGIMRVRPIFRNWAVKFRATIDTEQVDSEQLRESIMHAGSRNGLCDWTPRYGRFELSSLKAV